MSEHKIREAEEHEVAALRALIEAHLPNHTVDIVILTLSGIMLSGVVSVAHDAIEAERHLVAIWHVLVQDLRAQWPEVERQRAAAAAGISPTAKAH